MEKTALGSTFRKRFSLLFVAFVTNHNHKISKSWAPHRHARQFFEIITNFMKHSTGILTLNPIWFAVIFAVCLLSIQHECASRFSKNAILSTDQVEMLTVERSALLLFTLWTSLWMGWRVCVCEMWIIENPNEWIIMIFMIIIMISVLFAVVSAVLRASKTCDDSWYWLSWHVCNGISKVFILFWWDCVSRFGRKSKLDPQNIARLRWNRIICSIGNRHTVNYSKHEAITHQNETQK